ncbi:hypothetical protein K491DRAFT_721372 [Lophiostoma macrostomum CBS 122681]|uniref:Uncharacterized protein n=1 Tax=Lophiostoma macrostomum CBS 122681 TaxID=1314788 RepID=A0A6A6STH7_9PLEO|nr:hypothetical protein K491DRAFT_721372 [Lophiostoma macrostomum CBS 122681]
MPIFNDVLNSLVGGRPRLRSPGHRLNRVDAYRELIVFHDATNGPKPQPDSKTKLPIRTSIPRWFIEANNLWYDSVSAQSHAYYEEIDVIPAAAVGTDTWFPKTKTKHWHVIHPLQWDVVTEFSNLVLNELIKWIEESQDRFVGTSQQVEDFKAARTETAEIAKKELAKRGVKDVEREEGYLGLWDNIEADEAFHDDDHSNNLETGLTENVVK